MAFHSLHRYGCSLAAVICLASLQIRECRSASKTNPVKSNSSAGNLTFQTFKADAGEVRCIGFSPDGSMAITGHWNNVAKLWDVKTAAVLRELAGHTGVVLSVAFSPDGATAITGSSDNTAKLWNVKAGTELLNLTGHTGWVISTAFSPGGELVATGSQDGTTRLYSVVSGLFLRVVGSTGSAAPAALSIALGADTRMLIGFSNGTALLVGHDSDGAPHCDTDLALSCPSGLVGSIKPLSLVGHTGWVVSTATSPDGKIVMTGGHDGTVGLWNSSSGKRLVTLQGHTGSVASVAFSPKGDSVLTGTRDGVVCVWDTATGNELLRFGGKKLSNREKKKQGRALGVPPPPGSSITHVAFKPDGLTALVGFMKPGKSPPKPEDPERAKCKERCAAKGEPV